ncbi:MAG: MBOAT family protein [Acidimicrobiales bacterium]|jgi:D-alanyl-lipoteichoic acid acyltransferase DltB (MBOAT superfamily)|nr:MBOAT family protein [Acidimicrobiales bacterium]
MLFPTVDFAVFFVVVFTGSWMLRPYAQPWRWFLLLASCVFYLDPFSGLHHPFNPVALALLVGWAAASAAVLRATYTSDEPGRGTTVRAAVPLALAGAAVVLNVVLARWFPDPGDRPWRYLFLLVGSVVIVNQAFARAVFAHLGPTRERTPTSRWLVRAAVVFDLGVLGYFKYTQWFADIFHSMLGGPLGMDRRIFDIVLPIAISFFIFQAISYVIDVGRGHLRPIPLLDFAVYLTFFAHVVAGPIVRVGEFAPQLNQRADPRFVRSAEAFELIFRGMVKKVVISSYLAAQIVDPVFANPELYSRWDVLWAMYGYAIQIYADFSGYTDIAIGVALLLGIRFPQNFDAPYISLSIQEFWRRWHMTLSRWLRDYLYIPLGGNRGTQLETYRNLFLTMLLGGLWHGSNWTFVVWGAMHGGGLAAERWVKERWAQRGPLGLPPALVKGLQWFFTFNFVCVAWVFFRAQSFDQAWSFLGQLVGGTGLTAGLVTWVVLAVVVVSIASQFVPPRIPERITVAFARTAPIVQILVLAVGLFLVDAFGPEGIAPFIYFQF